MSARASSKDRANAPWTVSVVQIESMFGSSRLRRRPILHGTPGYRHNPAGNPAAPMTSRAPNNHARILERTLWRVQ